MSRHARGEEYGRLVLATIRAIRKENDACTSREIGRRLHVVHQLINRQLLVLRKAELVDWTPMPGSIHLTARGGKVASGGAMPELPTKANLERVAREGPKPPVIYDPMLRIAALEAKLASLADVLPAEPEPEVSVPEPPAEVEPATERISV